MRLYGYFFIFTFILGITIGLLVIVWLEIREISAVIQQLRKIKDVKPLGILQALYGTKLLSKRYVYN